LLAITLLSSALAVVGCAAPAANVASAPKTGAQFCAKERLYTANGAMVCNWAPTAADACRDNSPSSSIALAAVTGAPVDSRRCESGQWLVQVAMK
jgi:hypothetical protein